MPEKVLGKLRSINYPFPIEEGVCYCTMRRGRISSAGAGKTIQISSREIQFTTQGSLNPGERAQLAVEWPAVIGNACLLKLEIYGSVIWSLPGAAAVKIGRYEFRTRGAGLKIHHAATGALSAAE